MDGDSSLPERLVTQEHETSGASNVIKAHVKYLERPITLEPGPSGITFANDQTSKSRTYESSVSAHSSFLQSPGDIFVIPHLTRHSKREVVNEAK